jgi:O-antigen/teichoic acid export membrane protein
MRKRLRLRALGAVAAQFSQAFGSFVLQLVAARSLPLAEFGTFAVLVGGIVLATGIMTGFVGDSLTVLDRSDRRIRAALQVWCLVFGVAAFAAATLSALGSGLTDLRTGVLFGAATAVWVLEDTVRRLLMATFRFWSVVAIDLTHAAVALATLLVLNARSGRLTLADFMIALLIGQLTAIGVGLIRTAPAERVLVTWRGAAMGVVAGFGGWRGLQQGIRPLTLTVARTLVLLAAGKAAVGQLEAARVYMAPALLAVQGIGSFLLAIYAVNREVPIREAVRQADRAALALVACSLLLGAIATALVGWAGPLVVGDDYLIEPLAVAGWATFAASVAAVMPYASLASVRGRQARVVGLRLVDAAVSLITVAMVLWVVTGEPAVVPFAIAFGSLVGAILQRRVALSAPEPAVPAVVPEPN